MGFTETYLCSLYFPLSLSPIIICFMYLFILDMVSHIPGLASLPCVAEDGLECLASPPHSDGIMAGTTMSSVCGAGGVAQDFGYARPAL